jgi:hypothetical protein
MRIVVENFDLLDTYDTYPVEVIINYLKEIGAKIPVMLFTKTGIDQMNILHIQRSYELFLVTSAPKNLIHFSLMKEL